MRSAKVTAKAFNAGFHRMVHRACPVPWGSMPRVTRFSVLSTADTPSHPALPPHDLLHAAVSLWLSAGPATQVAEGPLATELPGHRHCIGTIAITV